MRNLLLCFILLVILGCSGQKLFEGTKMPGEFLRSNESLLDTSQISPEVIHSVGKGNSDFAIRFYHQLSKQTGNIFYSPYSFSAALAMVFAGARGTTEAQIAKGMSFTLPQEQLHSGFNALAQRLKHTTNEAGFILSMNNDLWLQKDYSVQQSYLDLLAHHYEGGLHSVDFKNNPEQLREQINHWISDRTGGKIQDLLSKNSLNSTVNFILTNTIYFKALWLNPFHKHDPSLFYALDTEPQNVSMMKGNHSYKYVRHETVEAIEIPYDNHKTSLVVLVPPHRKFRDFERNFSYTWLESLLSKMEFREVELTLPKFTIRSSIEAEKDLAALGITDAFDSNHADFSGIDLKKDIYLKSVVQRTFVSVDEAGTEAAAATAVSIVPTMIPPQPETPPIKLKVDRPFLFLIKDSNDVILFMGRYSQPT